MFGLGNHQDQKSEKKCKIKGITCTKSIKIKFFKGVTKTKYSPKCRFLINYKDITKRKYEFITSKQIKLAFYDP